MSAYPMLQRCFQAQWRGLPMAERVRLGQAWRQGLPASHLKAQAEAMQEERPIWSVARHGDGMTLISLKWDIVMPDDRP